MIFDPKTFFDHNDDLVERRCRENWIDDIKGARHTLNEVITKLDALRFDDNETRIYLDF